MNFKTGMIKEEKEFLIKKIALVISTLLTAAGFGLLAYDMLHGSKSWFPMLLCFALAALSKQLRTIF